MPVSGDQEARKCSMWCRTPRSESRDPQPGTCGRVLEEAPREGAQHGTGMAALVVVAVNGRAAVAIGVVGQPGRRQIKIRLPVPSELLCKLHEIAM